MEKWIQSETIEHIIPDGSKGVPTYFDAEKELAVNHPGYMTDSQFIAANLTAEDGREFGIMLHMMCVNPEEDPAVYPAMLSIISMTDFTDENYCVKEDMFTLPAMSYSEEKMDLKTPVSYMRQDGDKYYAGTELPDGKGRIDLEMTPVTPYLYNCAIGKFPFFAREADCYQFSVPGLTAEGVLKLDNREYRIKGDAWLDKQWGTPNEDFGKRMFKWSWMNLNLEDGTKISCWDVCPHGKTENAWATILTPGGAHMVVDMVPWSVDEGDYYVGATGQKYPTSYILRIPSVDGEFHVKVRGLPEQEIVSATGEDKYEAACVFTGRYMGKPTSGFNYVELVGSFQ